MQNTFNAEADEKYGGHQAPGTAGRPTSIPDKSRKTPSTAEERNIGGFQSPGTAGRPI
jgi:hypothetical protein